MKHQIKYQLISLQKLSAWGRLDSKVCIEQNVWLCSGFGTVLVFNEEEFNSTLLEEFLAGYKCERKDLIFDTENNLYTLKLPQSAEYTKSLGKHKMEKDAFSLAPLIRFIVISSEEFYELVPEEKWSTQASFIKSNISKKEPSNKRIK